MFNPIRSLARPLLASMFVAGGLDALRDPASKAPKAEDVARPIADEIPVLEGLETAELVRLNGAVQVLGGIALGLGKLPRLSAAALAVSLVPTTVAGHRFWEMEDEDARANHRTHFLKNLSMLGGLLLSLFDREGEPSAAWRAKHAAEHVGLEAEHTKREAGLAAKAAKAQAKASTAEARAAGRHLTRRAADEVEHRKQLLGAKAQLAKRRMIPDARDAAKVVSAVRS